MHQNDAQRMPVPPIGQLLTDNERYLLRAEVDAVSETVRACEYATNNATSPLGAE